MARKKRSHDGLKVAGILCGIVIAAAALAFFVSLGNSATTEVISRAQVAPTTQTASWFSSFTHAITTFVTHAAAPVTKIVVQAVNSIGSAFHSVQCNVWGYGIQNLY